MCLLNLILFTKTNIYITLNLKMKRLSYTDPSTISMEKRTIPEEILVEILARLPAKTIARFKSVSKTWNSDIESPYFRRLFLSVNTNSPSSWSLMFIQKYNHPITEALGFHGHTWDPPKSLSSYIMSFQPYPNLPTPHYHYIASSNGLIWIEIVLGHLNRISFVGNPILKQWVEIPPPPDNNYSVATGLVTRVENGVVTSFKVVRSCRSMSPSVWEVHVYSSETGLWSYKELSSVCRVFRWDPPVNIDGKLYLCVKDYRDRQAFGFLVAYDFYGDEDQCQVVPFPFSNNKYAKRCLTTSSGDVLYVEMLYRRFKVWRLSSNNDDSGLLWELSEEINMVSVGFDVYCIPLAMHPFENDIIYLWGVKHGCLVTGNLRTLEFVVHQESENWSGSSNGGCYRFNKFDSKMYMDDFRGGTPSSVIVLSQFVLPPGMDSLTLY